MMRCLLGISINYIVVSFCILTVQKQFALSPIKTKTNNTIKIVKSEVLKSLQGKLAQVLVEDKNKQNGGSVQSVIPFT